MVVGYHHFWKPPNGGEKWWLIMGSQAVKKSQIQGSQVQFFHHPNRFFSPNFPRILHGKTTIFPIFHMTFMEKPNLKTSSPLVFLVWTTSLQLLVFGRFTRNGVVDEGNATLGNVHRPWTPRCAHHGDLFMELGVPRVQPLPLIVEGRGRSKQGLTKQGPWRVPAIYTYYIYITHVKTGLKIRMWSFWGFIIPKEVEL